MFSFFFLGVGRGGGGGADVKTSCTIPFWPQYMTQTDIVRVIFSSLLRHARLFYKEYLLNFIIFGMVMHKNRKI